MIRLNILHNDPAIRQSLGETIRAVWPEAMVVEDSADLTLDLTQNTQPQRLKAIITDLQTQQRNRVAPKMLQWGNCTLDIMTRQFTNDGKTDDLTEKEVAVLVYLYQKKNPMTREDLLRDVWRYAAGVDTHTIETHIYRLRQKIEPQPDTPVILITTKDGYQLAANSKA